MKTIWKIAKAELNTLFCSPIAWLILIGTLSFDGFNRFGQL